MRTLRIGGVATLVLALAACPADRPVEEPALEMPPPAEPAPVEVPAAETVQLDDIAGTGVAGEVHATPRDDRTDLMVTVQNAPPNESLGARVQSGTCESPGPELARLSAIGTDGMGMGQSQTEVGHAPHLILDGNHIVAIYAPGTEPERDQPIACATLPQHAGMGAMPQQPAGP